MAAAAKREFDIVLFWKLDRFGRSLLHRKAALDHLRLHGVRFIATNQNIDTDESNPAARFLLHILMAAAEFERELIRERAAAGLKRYRTEYEAGKVGKGTRRRSRKNLAVGRPRRVFDRQKVIELGSQSLSLRAIASLGEGTVRRILQEFTGSSEECGRAQTCVPNQPK